MNSIWIIRQTASKIGPTARLSGRSGENSIESVIPPVKHSIVVGDGVWISEASGQGSAVRSISIGTLNFVEREVGPIQDLILIVHCDGIGRHQIGIV